MGKTRLHLQQAAISDGWMPLDYTLPYASASSVTVSGVDVTSIFTKGTRVKFTNNATTYYSVVISSSFATNTTINFAPNNDYSIANSAITNPYYSYAVNPQGYPGWFNYTPTYSATGSMTYSSVTTNTAKFRVDGNVCTLDVEASGTIGGSASYGINFTLPFATSNQYSIWGVGIGNTTGVSSGVILSNYNLSSTTQAQVSVYNVSNWSTGSPRDFNIGGQYQI